MNTYQYPIDDQVKGHSESTLRAGQTTPFSKLALNVYDFFILNLSNRYVWHCPTDLLVGQYNRYASGKHLDVGIGTGYFLDHCQFPSANPHIALVDLNTDPLLYVRKRLERYTNVHLYRRNVLEPLGIDDTFDSIGLNYLLHCVHGPIEDKADRAFANLKPLLNEGGVLFGATLLQERADEHRMGRLMTGIYNRTGTFSMEHDREPELRAALSKNFSDFDLEVVGCAALFRARV